MDVLLFVGMDLVFFDEVCIFFCGWWWGGMSLVSIGFMVGVVLWLLVLGGVVSLGEVWWIGVEELILYGVCMIDDWVLLWVMECMFGLVILLLM